MVVPPDPHHSGARPPKIPARFVPKHVAVVMDGNGRWANERGLPRNEGHKAGEKSLVDVVAGAIEMGIPYVSAYAFSTENWKRSLDEISFIMRFTTEVLTRQLETLQAWGVRVLWAGRKPKLWNSVIKQLQYCEEQTKNNTVCTLVMCVNYGGRAEIADATAKIAQDVAAGKLKASAVSEKTIGKYLYNPDVPDVDLFLRSSGELRTSNFLLWESAYAELIFLDVLWPDVDRITLWKAVEIYAQRDRRYGAAIDKISS
ncbi:isoprenyl transferase [uncultured Rothia sp.]|uniref:isoprenyl transferase n=1 Tax=uncultured Rothia sp. TaxID=316088 RepID=UPI0032167336